jgi:hypothetical protein
MLTRVTISGADDGVDPARLAALSREFPFVEWGILYSKKREGESRYPSEDWRMELGLLRKRTGMTLAFHLCGEASRDTLSGSRRWVGMMAGRGPFRVQLNGYTPIATELQPLRPDIEWILQVRSESALQSAAHDARRLDASALFDPSGGRGIEPFSWPCAPFGLRMGYAGGINPDTVLGVLEAIGPVSRDFWIDMESGVRTDDRFDLRKARLVLERTAPLVGKAS